MAISLEQVFQYTIAGLLGETTRKVGEKNVPATLTATGPVFDTGNFTVADDTTSALVWSTGNGGLTTPSYIVVMSSVELFVEIANTTPNPDERMLFRIPANAVCVIPSSVMGGYASNTTRLDDASLVLNTDYGAITELRVQNNGADLAGDATVRVVLIG